MGLTLGAGAAGWPLVHAAEVIPRKSPELTLRMDFGAQLRLGSLRGKVVCVEFLLTTCIHCQRCAAMLERMYEEFGPRGFTVLGAAINDNAGALIAGFVGSLGLKFPVGVCTQDQALEYLQWDPNTQGPPMMPQLVFVDRQGVVRSRHAGNSDYFRAGLDQHLREEIAGLLGLAGAAPIGK
jgi:hypothetical protein